jgi:hypothetical protein
MSKNLCSWSEEKSAEAVLRERGHLNDSTLEACIKLIKGNTLPIEVFGQSSKEDFDGEIFIVRKKEIKLRNIILKEIRKKRMFFIKKEQNKRKTRYLVRKEQKILEEKHSAITE